jgi:putative oxidoreductase
MVDDRTAGYAALLLRVVAGLLFLAHDAVKIFIFTPAGTAGFFGSIGLPPALAYVTIALELVGGVALILGLWPRLVAIVMAALLVGTIYAVHGANGFLFTNANGGWEYPAFWALALVALALIGDGAFALAPTPVPNSADARAA